MKELKWCEERPRPDGEVNSCMAQEIVSIPSMCKICITYSVVRGPSYATDKNFWAVVFLPNGKEESREVRSMAEGKLVCEEYRTKFWKQFMSEIQRVVGTV